MTGPDYLYGMTHWALLVLIGFCGCNNESNLITPDDVYKAVFEQYPQSWYPIPFPLTGPADNRFTAFDVAILEFMLENKIPGASVVVYDGEHMYQKAFGWSDVESAVPVHPDSVFRTASISKTITAAGILHLHREHKLEFEDKAVPLLQNANILTDAVADSKLLDITLRDLLLHQGGWDEDEHYDPMLRETTRRAIVLYALEHPPAPSDILRYAMRQPLRYFPGSRFSYSNMGYVLLGRVIESTSNQTYETYIQDTLLIPNSLNSIQLGATCAENALPSEVMYYELSSENTLSSVLQPDLEVLLPYGAFSLEVLDAAAGWTAPASELALFAHIFYQEFATVLTNEAHWVDVNDQGLHYGLGLFRSQASDHTYYWHSGSMSGTLSLICITQSGQTAVVLMNARPEKWQGSDRILLETLLACDLF